MQKVFAKFFSGQTKHSPDINEIESEYHFLPHFNPNTNVNADLIGYEYKTDSSNPDTFSI